jgi:type II secretory pathway predicted ATPase ExeA
MIELRQRARQELRVYMSRTGLGLREIADDIGYAHRTLLQFASGARFGLNDLAGKTTGERVLAWMAQNPAPLPDFPGKLYETAATRQMDSILADIREGAWGTLYGPAGAQKTFFLRYRYAEAARDPETDLALVECDYAMSPRLLLARIGQIIAAPFAYGIEPLRRAIMATLRKRQRPLALALDEAQLLYKRFDTLETLRRLGDAAGPRLGILIAGNEQVTHLFDTRPAAYMEQWRSRIDQIDVRVLGPTTVEARRILAEEIPSLKDRAAELIIEGATVNDPISKKPYVNARRLFYAIRDFRRTGRKAN